MDYEKLGAFYLGKTYDLEKSELQDEVVLYDSKDLTTHAVIIGMTGSGKTGLGLDILEEALIDNIPLIAIDPKGDLGNLLLTFPELSAEAFRPWVNEQEAANQGQTADEYAAAQAELWEKGLGEWGQDAARIAKLRQSVEMAVYTPGSSAGLPVSVLRSFDAPPEALKEDADLWRERVQTSATSLLALLDIDADPVTSREHILLANIFEQTWSAGKNLDLAGLIRAIQEPPFERIGVMDLDQIYPAKERFELAMKLNSLLAAPGFEAWLTGDPLNIGRLLHTEDGKPRASIFTISHLSDSERMFFVTTLLNELLTWTRTQKGTSSLRAILYMDEIFGYLPPTANPPSKTPLLTMLKQARAFGVGLVLSTQNPVDLDYKALSNAGTWFIGRLQTERDKARVAEGLLSAAPTGLDKAETEAILSGLGKRVFLLHNVHEDAPVVFQTRWAMSYLSGPMTREQIKRLMADEKQSEGAAPTNGRLSLEKGAGEQGAGGKKGSSQSEPVSTEPETQTEAEVATSDASEPPIMPQDVPVYYAPASGAGAGLVYYPAVAGFAEVHYSSATHKVSETQALALTAEIGDGPVSVDWDDAEVINLDASDLEKKPLAGATFTELPKAATTAKAYTKWQKDLLKHVRQDRPLKLYKCKAPKLTSAALESEGDFRARLSQLAREERDLEVEKLRKKYASKLTTLQDRLRRAEQAVQKETEQAQQKRMETFVNVGSALLGAALGRKVMSRTNTSKTSSALKSVGRMQKEQMDIGRAEETAAAVGEQIVELEAELEQELAGLASATDPTTLGLEEVLVKAKSSDITLDAFALVWLPYRQDAQGRLSADWG